MILGQEFLEAVLELNTGAATPCPRTRCALLAANLTARQRSDGIAKLLMKTEVNQLKNKDNIKQVLEFEEMSKTGQDPISADPSYPHHCHACSAR